MRGVRPRIALVAPYWDFWERSVPYDLRAERAGLLADARAARAGRRAAAGAAPAPHAEVACCRSIASREDGAAFAREALAEGCEVAVVLQSMAVPPAFAGAALEALPGLPLVIWTAHRTTRVRPDFSHGDITSEGATVGAPMLTNVLVRSGRPFALVLGRLHDPDVQRRVADAATAGAVARRLGRSRVGRVGGAIDGYDCVVADSERLQQATGIEIVPIEPAELRDRYLAVAAPRIAELERETRATFDVEATAEGETLARSLRAACAIEDLVADHRLDAGAMNCHVPEIRLGPEVGIAPCFGLGRSTSAGIPWSCAGDVVTAVALLTTSWLGGAALYHELESLDYETGELVVANSGEHDLAFCDPAERPVLRRNDWYLDDPVTGACACFGAPAGPATLVAFTQLDAPAPGYRYIAAAGEFTTTRWPAAGTPYAAFRFRNGPSPAAWERWARAGANHHSSATPGDLAGQVSQVAAFLGVDAVRI
jgi:L-arabinose isomerase